MDDFWSYVWVTETCWLWTGTVSGKYGKYNQRLAHRVSLELYLGRPIARGMDVAHAPLICHNPLCVNPEHLSEKTRSANQQDRVLDGTSNRGERQGISKLTADQVIAIRADTRPYRVIAEEYGIHRDSCSDIKRRKSWAWL